MRFPSVIVDDLDFEGLRLPPDEADPPLVVDSDAVLSAPPSFQGLQTISGWDSEVLEGSRSVQQQELAPRHAFESSEPRHVFVVKEVLRVLPAERTDHRAV